MQKSRLIEVLRSFSEREKQQFDKYLTSPYHNTQADLVRLHQHIAFALQQKIDAALDKKYVYEKLFPERLYKDIDVRVMMSALLKHAERFLSVEQHKKDPATVDFHLAQVYRQRQLTKSFHHTLKNVHIRSRKTPSYNAHTHYRQSLMYEEEYLFSFEENRQTERDLQRWHDSLNHFFIAETLRQVCALLTHERVAEKEYDFLLLDDILKQIEAHPELLDIPAIYLYYHSYHTLTGTQNNKHFRQLKEGIIRYGVGFPQAELKGFYTLSINHCIRQNNKNEGTIFLRELLELYQVGLSQDAFMENGFLSRWTYKNIVYIIAENNTIKLSYNYNKSNLMMYFLI